MSRSAVEKYRREVEKRAARWRELALRSRDIGPLPAPEHPRRRKSAEKSLSTWASTYFPNVFVWPFSETHLRVIDRIESAISSGGCFAYALPRGCGKTSLSLAASLWALVTGRSQYVLVVTANGIRARQSLATVLTWIQTSKPFVEDYPEIAIPILAIEGSPQRIRGQVCDGKPTRLRIAADRIVFPDIDGSLAAGSLFHSVPLRGGSIRGLQHALPDGRTIRPQTILIDDPQTRDSASSSRQCEYRRALIQGDILGTMAHEYRAAVFCTCTVIRRGDLSDQLLALPEWCGERAGILLRMPENLEAWGDYERVYREAVRRRDYASLRKYYEENREQLERGAVPLWPECYDRRTEVSAIQHAMHLYLQDRGAFLAEYQNEPASDQLSSSTLSIAPELVDESFVDEVRISPSDRVGVFVDVQEQILYYAICAKAEESCFWICGTWPQQGGIFFSASRPALPLGAFYSCDGPQALGRGLAELLEQLRAAFPESTILVDAGYRADVVVPVAAKFPDVFPSWGRYVGARSRTSVTDRIRPGDVSGDVWRLTRDPDRSTSAVLFDANAAKTTVARLFGERRARIARTPEYRVVADHLSSEVGTETQSVWRKCVEWSLLPARENHFFDAVVGSYVAFEVAKAIRSEEPGAEENWIARGLARYKERVGGSNHAR